MADRQPVYRENPKSLIARLVLTSGEREVAAHFGLSVGAMLHSRLRRCGWVAILAPYRLDAKRLSQLRRLRHWMWLGALRRGKQAASLGRRLKAWWIGDDHGCEASTGDTVRWCVRCGFNEAAHQLPGFAMCPKGFATKDSEQTGPQVRRAN